MVHTSQSPNSTAPKRAVRRSRAGASGPKAALAKTPSLVKVSIGAKVHEVEGVGRGNLNRILQTVTRGARKGHGAEVTLRFVDGAVQISEIRPAAAAPAPALEVITGRSPELEAALERARERGRHRVAEILERPEMLNAETFGARLGLSRVAVNDRRQKREVLGLEGAKRGVKYPEWQIGEDGKPFAALPSLFERLGDSPWAVYRFLTQPHGELEGRTALEVLRQGDAHAVLDTAEGVARGTFA